MQIADIFHGQLSGSRSWILSGKMSRGAERKNRGLLPSFTSEKTTGIMFLDSYNPAVKSAFVMIAISSRKPEKFGKTRPQNKTERQSLKRCVLVIFMNASTCGRGDALGLRTLNARSGARPRAYFNDHLMCVCRCKPSHLGSNRWKSFQECVNAQRIWDSLRAAAQRGAKK